MKKAAVIIGVVCLLAGVAQADIGVRASSGGGGAGGVYLDGGSWLAGPWPAAGSLYQLIWSPVAPVVEDLTLDQAQNGKAGELILASGPVLAYGQLSPQPIVAVAGDVNNAYVFMRIFQDDTPDLNDLFYQSAPTGPPLPAYDAAVPGTEFIHEATGPVGQATNGQVIPEPATLGLWGLGLLTIIVRRKIRR